MIYDYCIHTGLFLERQKYNLVGGGSHVLKTVISTGRLEILSSLNSQTLLETIPIDKLVGINHIIYNTGDFYLSGFGVYLDTGLNSLATKNLLYEITQTGLIRFHSGDSGHLQTGFMRSLSSGMSGQVHTPVVFINGQKVYSGIDYHSKKGTFLWANFFDVSGKMFSYVVPSGESQQFGTGKYDMSGDIKYNKGATKLYCGGLQQDQGAFLETSSVSTNITGLSSFLPIREETSYTLFF